ncbi:MAG: biopolymer transporter ExbD [Calditrichaeota bacterium]|nr:MAG: biopolymer transporter ExbD [Calditrichota bacterium]
MKQKRKKKNGGGSIIRLIDVVMILLFGFIAISEIDTRSKIQLAKSTTVPITRPDREVVEYIGVLPDGRYLVEHETQQIDELEVLQLYLQNKLRAYQQASTRLKVRIRTNYDAPVKYAFRVVNICQNLGIPVGLDVVKKNQ